MPKKLKTMFDVYGPYEIPLGKNRSLPPEKREKFWTDHKDIAERKGCYVFAMQTRGLTPYYVGMTVRSFEKEALNDRNVANFVMPTISERKGTPVLLFLTAPEKKGPINRGHIRKLEKFLIRQSLLVNLDLKNSKSKKTSEWGIKGVFRGGQGSRSDSADSLRKCIGLYANDDIYFYSTRSRSQ